MIYHPRMLVTSSCAWLFVLATTGTATGDKGDGVAAAEMQPAAGKPAAKSKSKKKGRVLRFPHRDGLEEIVPVAPGTATVWHFPEKVVSHVVGDKVDYPRTLDEQGRRLMIQPMSGALPTNVNVETTKHMTFFLRPPGKGEVPASLVIIERAEPAREESAEGEEATSEDAQDEEHDTTIDQVDEYFATYPAKSARFEQGGYVLVGEVTEQHREGDSLTCRYKLVNEGLGYPVAAAQIQPLGSEVVLDATVAVDGDRRFPLELRNGMAMTGSIHVRAGASLLEKGFVLRLLPSRLGPPLAVMGFKEKPENVGRLAIQVQGLAGAINLENGSDPEQTDFAVLGGGGVLAVYGVGKHVSLEGSLSVLTTTGGARFDDSSTADATSVRALFGGRLHVGETFVPFVRAGLGVRVANFSWTSSGGASDSELRGSMALGIGVGVDAWFGESLVAGASAGAIGRIASGGDNSYSFEASIHAGYAWKP